MYVGMVGLHSHAHTPGPCAPPWQRGVWHTAGPGGNSWLECPGSGAMESPRIFRVWPTHWCSIQEELHLERDRLRSLPDLVARDVSALGGQRVGLGRHDEVVPMEPADLVGPPGNRDSSPFSEQ